MIKCSILILILIHTILFQKENFETDSCTNTLKDTVTLKKNGQIYVSSKFRQLSNYQHDTRKEFDLSIKLDWKRIKYTNSFLSKQELISELSFTKYIDSITFVDEDLIEFTSNWEFKLKSLLNTINLKIQSQFTNSYEYVFLNNSYNKVLSKEFPLPVSISIGTGFNYTFDKSNYVNISLFDIKTTIITRKIGESSGESQRLTSSLFHIPKVGISINSSIHRTSSKETFTWRNNSKIFAKGFTKNDININFRNRFMYEIYKWVNISLENQILYDPLFNYKLQLRNEVVVGVLFRK